MEMIPKFHTIGQKIVLMMKTTLVLLMWGLNFSERILLDQAAPVLCFYLLD